jgi:hypothetical protein
MLTKTNQNVIIRAVITRADGKVEDCGIVSMSNPTIKFRIIKLINKIFNTKFIIK